MSIFTAIANIVSWFFNPDRWAARQKEKKFKDIKKWEGVLAEALIENDTKMISVARYKLKELREKIK